MTGGLHDDARQWTAAETKELIELQSRNGNAWASFALHFRRSPSSVRNKYQRITKAAVSRCKNKCKACGKPRRGHVCYKEIQNLYDNLPESVYKADFNPLLEGDDDMKFDFEEIQVWWAEVNDIGAIHGNAA